VCPEHIHITDNALIPLKERVADKRYDPIFSIASLFSRNKDTRNPAPETPKG
jgi:succinate dehydrogenase / fumarate reductase iron-sulfur subunit